MMTRSTAAARKAQAASFKAGFQIAGVASAAVLSTLSGVSAMVGKVAPRFQIRPSRSLQRLVMRLY